MKLRAGLCTLLVVLGSVTMGCGVPAFLSRNKPVTLRYAYDASVPEMEELVSRFHEAYPHIMVELLPGEGQSAAALGQRMPGGEIDLLRSGRQALGLARQELLRPLGSADLAEWAEQRDDYYAGVWDGLAVSGQQFGIPAGLDALVTYVNMDAMAVLGLGLPEPGDRWDRAAFLDLATRLHHPAGLPQDPAGSLYGFCTDPMQLDPLVFVYLSGGTIVDDLRHPRRTTLDNLETVEALAWYVDLFGPNAVTPSPTFLARAYGPAGAHRVQAAGYCGLWLGLLSDRGGAGSDRWPFAWHVLPLPQTEATLMVQDIEGYYIPAGGPHPEEALLLARFLGDHWQAAGQHLPPRRSLVADPGYAQAAGSQGVAQAANAAESLLILPDQVSPELAAVAQAVLEALRYSIEQGADIVPLLQEAQQEAERLYRP